ncbi:triple tyrosine motif-containing protein [Clostridium cavendishii]|nr:triple tyrosine motif-containing protein [Clostridium cavendishii]
MKDLLLELDKSSPQELGQDIIIEAKFDKAGLLYKFLIGKDGMWETLEDFSEYSRVVWTPKEEGEYMILVQAKNKKSKKPFDYKGTVSYIIGNDSDKLISNIYIDKKNLSVGEKLSLEVETTKVPCMFRYLISSKAGWQIIKDYTVENKINYTVREGGEFEILVECKKPESSNNFDDFKTIKFEVKDVDKPEITNFKCLTNDLLVGEELVFQVDAKYSDDRTLLYKFVKLNPDGKVYCIQDYSSRRMVTYTEKERGTYKLLCLIRDMYSTREYDDRAIIVYEVMPYNNIEIQSFTTDISSPQVNGTNVLLKAVAEGGKNLLYRFKIDGNYGEDSGYTRNSSYLWTSKYEGEYRLIVEIKDESFNGEYEAKAEIEYVIEKKCNKPVKILDLVLDKNKNYLINEPVNIKVIAEGGTDLKYEFLVYKDEKEIEKMNYGNANWVNFTPESEGQYKFEIRVKDKYSQKEYDAHSIIHFNVKAYIPGEIEYILVPSNGYFLVGDIIEIEAITQNTSEVLMKYVTKINDQIVEETEFIQNKKMILTPKCAGKYIVEIFAKNKKCKEGFDSKREVKVYVNEAPPITETKIICDKKTFKVNEEINFSGICQGGKEVCYEYYLMQGDNWNLVQRYSRKDYYAFRPFRAGTYRMLLLTKSYYKKSAYEDYDNFEFIVEE